MLQFFNDPCFSDVVFVYRELFSETQTHRLYASKFLLASHVDYFRILFLKHPDKRKFTTSLDISRLVKSMYFGQFMWQLSTLFQDIAVMDGLRMEWQLHEFPVEFYLHVLPIRGMYSIALLESIALRDDRDLILDQLLHKITFTNIPVENMRVLHSLFRREHVLSPIGMTPLPQLFVKLYNKWRHTHASVPEIEKSPISSAPCLDGYNRFNHIEQNLWKDAVCGRDLPNLRVNSYRVEGCPSYCVPGKRNQDVLGGDFAQGHDLLLLDKSRL